MNVDWGLGLVEDDGEGDLHGNGWRMRWMESGKVFEPERLREMEMSSLETLVYERGEQASFMFTRPLGPDMFV